jgi:hypothetical protein
MLFLGSQTKNKGCVWVDLDIYCQVIQILTVMVYVNLPILLLLQAFNYVNLQ